MRDFDSLKQGRIELDIMTAETTQIEAMFTSRGVGFQTRVDRLWNDGDMLPLAGEFTGFKTGPAPCLCTKTSREFSIVCSDVPGSFEGSSRTSEEQASASN